MTRSTQISYILKIPSHCHGIFLYVHVCVHARVSVCVCVCYGPGYMQTYIVSKRVECFGQSYGSCRCWPRVFIFCNHSISSCYVSARQNSYPGWRHSRPPQLLGRPSRSALENFLVWPFMCLWCVEYIQRETTCYPQVLSGRRARLPLL